MIVLPLAGSQLFLYITQNLGTIVTFGVWPMPLPGAVFVLSKSHNEKGREEELVTPVVAVVSAESPACTINRVSCYMPTHMGSLSGEVLIGRPIGSKFEMVRHTIARSARIIHMPPVHPTSKLLGSQITFYTVLKLLSLSPKHSRCTR